MHKLDFRTYWADVHYVNIWIIASKVNRYNGGCWQLGNVQNGSNAAAPGRQASWPRSNSTVTMTARVFHNSGEQEERLGTTRSHNRTTLQPVVLYKVTAGEVIVKIVMRLHLTSYNM